MIWTDPEGNTGTVIPYIVGIPISLWGRDILQQLKLKLTNNYSTQSQDMMLKMGFIPGKGLGRRLQGCTNPIESKGNKGTQGLGFS